MLDRRWFGHAVSDAQHRPQDAPDPTVDHAETADTIQRMSDASASSGDQPRRAAEGQAGPTAQRRLPALPELIAALAARYPQLAARDTDYAVKTVPDANDPGPGPSVSASRSAALAASLSQRFPASVAIRKSGEQVLVPG